MKTTNDAHVVDFPGGSAGSAQVTAAVQEPAAVRMTLSGQLLGTRGDAALIAETTAFLFHLGNLVGDALGLGEVQAMEGSSSRQTLVLYRHGAEQIVAFSGSRDELAPLAKKEGLW